MSALVLLHRSPSPLVFPFPLVVLTLFPSRSPGVRLFHPPLVRVPQHIRRMCPQARSLQKPCALPSSLSPLLLSAPSLWPWTPLPQPSSPAPRSTSLPLPPAALSAGLRGRGCLLCSLPALPRRHPHRSGQLRDLARSRNPSGWIQHDGIHTILVPQESGMNAVPCVLLP